jgi:hypothetical protein
MATSAGKNVTPKKANKMSLLAEKDNRKQNVPIGAPV